MITKDFINEFLPQNTTATQPIVMNTTSEPAQASELLKKFHQKHCSTTTCRTPELFSFVSAARAVGIDKSMVEKYIKDNIKIAPDSSKADPKNLHGLIEDAYRRYPIGNYVSDSTYIKPAKNHHLAFKADFDDGQVDVILEQYKRYNITSQSNFPVPAPIISLNGESIATEGNIVSVSGLQKSGKSSLCNIIMAGALSNNLDGVPEQLKIMQSNGKAVIHIDTEQAKHRHQWNVKSILKRGGIAAEPDYFHSYNVRGMATPEAVQMLNEVFFAASKKHGGIHFALIDGIADFVTSVNDEEQCNAIIKMLDALAVHYNTLIIVVIHRNPNDGKVRGHLGSNLLRKCEAVVAVKKDGDNSYINPEELRTASKGDIPKYLFAYNKQKGYHCYVGQQTVEQKKDKQQG